MGRGYKTSINTSGLRITSNVNKIKLRQLGAEVKSIQSKIYRVTFMVNDTKLEYYYNINESGKFFLERMAPYYKNFQVFTEENSAIKAIYEDVEHFRNASKSNNFYKFIDLSIELEKLHDAYADMFLHHNVPEQDMQRIGELLDKVKAKVNELNTTTKELIVESNIDELE